MNSGAVHDSSLLAGVTNVGMIFVPSVNGRSHVQYEKTEFEDIKQGCDLLLGAIYKLSI
jgi:allantoate deiminase